MAPAVGGADHPAPRRPGAAAGRVVVLPPEAFAAGAAARLARLLREAASRGSASLALAGGSTPRPVYRRLAEAPEPPWSRLRIFFGDERRVPADDPAGNYRMAREALLDRVPLPPDAVHRMRGEARDPAREARRYEGLLPAHLDLLLLGIGEDGHTASLFPRSSALGEARRRVLPVEAPVEPRGRYTVTPPVIAAARRVVVLAAGSAKAAAVARALEGSWEPAACPAQLARAGEWLLDREAAAGLAAAPAAGRADGPAAREPAARQRAADT